MKIIDGRRVEINKNANRKQELEFLSQLRFVLENWTNRSLQDLPQFLIDLNIDLGNEVEVVQSQFKRESCFNFEIFTREEKIEITIFLNNCRDNFHYITIKLRRKSKELKTYYIDRNGNVRQEPVRLSS